MIPTSEELDTDVLGTMNSLQCFKDRERLVAELLNSQYVLLSISLKYYQKVKLM